MLKIEVFVWDTVNCLLKNAKETFKSNNRDLNRHGISTL